MLNRCTDWIKGENLRARNIGSAGNSDGPRRTHHRRFAGPEDAERQLHLCRSHTGIHGQCEGIQVEPWPRTVSTPLPRGCGRWAVISGDGCCSVTGFSVGGVLGLRRPIYSSSAPNRQLPVGFTKLSSRHVCTPPPPKKRKK